MAIQINSYERILVKFASLTPANFGMQWGAVAVDSPTQVDAQYGLPYIPDSAIKGVLAAEQELASGRTSVWGKADNWEATTPSFGNPAKIIFGNAHIVMFPVLFEDGKRAFIIPIHQLLYFQELAGFEFINLNLFQDIINTLLYEDLSRTVAICLKKEFKFVSPIEISFLRSEISAENFNDLQGIARIIADNYSDNILFVGPHTASRLWKRFSEKREQIRINKKNITSPGSLRKIELIPEESVFISFVTNFSDQPFELPDLISAGAWEKNGFGWFHLSKIEKGENNNAASQSIRFHVNCTPLMEHTIMKSIYRDVRAAAFDENIARKIKAIIHNFGYYWKRYGSEAALAFELAKAKPEKTTDSPEAYSHRWFLKQLLDLSDEPSRGKSKYQALQTRALNMLKNPPISEVDILKMEKRLNWLRRFSELEF